MMLSAITDPEGVEQRRKHRLKRRVYHNKVCQMYRFHACVLSSAYPMLVQSITLGDNCLVYINKLHNQHHYELHQGYMIDALM